MSRTRKAPLIAVVLLIYTGFGGWVIYEMFIEGTTAGPDFISAIHSDYFAADQISSIEVVDPEVGYTASTAKELESLARRAEIVSAVTIRRLLALLGNAQ